MTKAEKEILDYTVKYEKRVLKELEKVYKEALDNIDDKVLELIARKDANEDYVVYQAEFQNMLKEQIQASLDMLHFKEYTTVNDYLVDCYNTGFTSAMYNIQTQGIPLVIPISQEDIIRAITNDTKLSDSLYNSLGKNIKTLKKQITQTLSVGIATSQSYSDISRNLSNVAQVNRNKTMRIARTEGHRIQQASNYNACKKAYSKGANIVKQWSSTLDNRTRDSHRQVDGEIRELDEYFSNGLLIPGDKDAPACEVVNCRCTISQRAKWRLDEKELKTLQDRAKFFGLDKIKNFDDFKQKYLQFLTNGDTLKVKKVYKKSVNIGGLTSYPKKYHAQIIDFLNNAPDVCRKAWNDVCDDFHTITATEYKNKTGKKATGAFYSSYVDAVYLNIRKASKGSSYQTPFQVVFHEFGHHMDYIFNRKYGDGDKKKAFSETYKDGIFGKTLKKEAQQAIMNYATSKEIDDWDEAETEFIKEVISKYSLLGRSDISDMFEPVTTKAYPFGTGHGKSYWDKRDNGKEGFAEMYSAIVSSPESWKAINEYFPKSVEIFEEILKVVK